MAVRLPLKQVVLLGSFFLFTFGTGVVLMLATSGSTELRSRASGPYDTCAAACAPENGGIGGAACTVCRQETAGQPTPTVASATSATSIISSLKNALGNVIKRVLPSSGIGTGEDVGCPAGQTEYRSTSGKTVWCY